jgi:phage tail-like protein
MGIGIFNKNDPIQTFSYFVNVAGAAGALFGGFFSEISGFNLEITPVEYKTFNSKTGMPEVQIVPGRINSGTLTLKRGFTDNLAFYLWCRSLQEGHLHDARSTVTIGTFTRAYFPNSLWTLFNAWPSKYELDSLASETGKFRLESMTLVYERMEFVPPAF